MIFLIWYEMLIWCLLGKYVWHVSVVGLSTYHYIHTLTKYYHHISCLLAKYVPHKTVLYTHIISYNTLTKYQHTYTHTHTHVRLIHSLFVWFIDWCIGWCMYWCMYVLYVRLVFIFFQMFAPPCHVYLCQNGTLCHLHELLTIVGVCVRPWSMREVM